MVSFKQSLESAEAPETLASVYCPITARMAVDLGFSYGMVGGSVASLSMLGTPDLMLLTATELCDLVKRVSQSSALKVIVDGDAGYGNALNTIRTVIELEMAGASAVTLEDTKLPISYGQHGVELLSVSEQIDKLSAALDARSSNAFGLIARTQICPSEDIGRVADRVDQYTQTGVDAICLAGVTDPFELESISAATDLPIMLITYGKRHSLSATDYRRFNVKLVLSGHLAFEASVLGAYKALAELSGMQEVDASIDAKKLITQYADTERFDQSIRKYLAIRK